MSKEMNTEELKELMMRATVELLELDPSIIDDEGFTLAMVVEEISDLLHLYSKYPDEAREIQRIVGILYRGRIEEDIVKTICKCALGYETEGEQSKKMLDGNMIINEAEEMLLEELSLLNKHVILQDESHYLTITDLLRKIDWLTDLWAEYPEREEKYKSKLKINGILFPSYFCTLTEIASRKAKRGKMEAGYSYSE